MLKENVLKKFSPLIKKVWLSSPTMHGEELKYMQEAYETNWMSTVGENINAVEQMLCEKNWLQICRCSCLWYCGFAYGSQIGRGAKR